MWLRLSSIFLVLAALGCDSEPQTAPLNAGSACILGAESEPPTDHFLLPTFEAAARLDVAEKNRQQGTINLLLAKYDTRSAPSGSKCQVVETRQDFANVQAQSGKLSGWLPLKQLRADNKAP